MSRRGGGGLIRTMGQIDAAIQRIEQGNAKPEQVAAAAGISRAQWFNLKRQLEALGVKIEFSDGAYVLQSRGPFAKKE